MLLFARFAFLLMLFPMFADAGMTSMRERSAIDALFGLAASIDMC